MNRLTLPGFLVASFTFVAACSSGLTAAPGTGGSRPTGGSSGGATSLGGATGSGGTAASSGGTSLGGATGPGTTASGGGTSFGGATGSGGASASGGTALVAGTDAGVSSDAAAVEDAGPVARGRDAGGSATPDAPTDMPMGGQGGGLEAGSLVDCGALPAVANGSVNAPVTTYGATATYACSAGYSLAGPTARTCQIDGTWSGKTPTCSLVECGLPSGISKARPSQVGTAPPAQERGRAPSSSPATQWAGPPFPRRLTTCLRPRPRKRRILGDGAALIPSAQNWLRTPRCLGPTKPGSPPRRKTRSTDWVLRADGFAPMGSLWSIASTILLQRQDCSTYRPMLLPMDPPTMRQLAYGVAHPI